MGLQIGAKTYKNAVKLMNFINRFKMMRLGFVRRTLTKILSNFKKKFACGLADGYTLVGINKNQE